MPLFTSTLRLSKLPIIGVVPEKSGVAPTSPVTGQLWTDTSVTPNLVRQWDGTAWETLLRYFGTIGGSIAQGNDARLSDQRATIDGSVTGGTAGAGVKIAASTITDVNVAAANKDGVAGALSLRTIGTGAQQAMAGNTRLDTIAAPTAAVGLNAQRLINGAASIAATDFIIRSELDSARQGFAGAKDPVRVASSANVALVAPGATVDAVTLVAGDRFLAYGQTVALENGIYVFNGSATAATRAPDADTFGEVRDGTTVATGEGTNQGSIFIETATLTAAPGAAGGQQSWVVFSTGGTTYVGTANRVTVTGTVIDISAAYVGQTSITSVGTLTTGTLGAGFTTVTVAQGGTGATTPAAARTSLGASQAGFRSLIASAIVAGTPLLITHNLGTDNLIAQVRDATTGEYVYLDIIDAPATPNTLTITSGVAFAANALDIVIIPI